MAKTRVSAQKGKIVSIFGRESRGHSDDLGSDLASEWADISQGLRKDLGHQLFSQWIRPIQVGSFCKDTGTLHLFLPTEFSANWVQDRFADRLSLAWKIARSDVKNVKIAVHPGRRKLAELDFKGEDGFGHRVANDSAMLIEDIVHGSFSSSVGLDPSFTFDAFVTGSTNVLAKSAAERIGKSKSPQTNPLYVKGGSGQGKTHLLHAIGHSYLQAHPRARIFYCSAERFMVEFVQALKSNEMIEFKTRLRGFDLLLVDDIQFIIGKASAQEELLYTIDALLAEGKRLVFAADRAPQALDGVEPRLLSRLSMGLVADITPADIDLRRAILQSRLTRFAPLEVPEDVIEFLARTINRNVRELLGGLNKLIAYAQLTGQELSLQLAEEQLTDILSANRRRITIDEIQRTVCRFYRIDRAEMSSKRRARAVVRPRQVAMYLAKVLTPRSYPEIGRKFGGRDYSTVIHAVRLIEDLRQRDLDLDGDVRSLLRTIDDGAQLEEDAATQGLNASLKRSQDPEPESPIAKAVERHSESAEDASKDDAHLEQEQRQIGLSFEEIVKERAILILGGEEAISLYSSSILQAIRGGFPSIVISHLRDSGCPADLMTYIAPERTLSRRLSEGQKLRADESDRAWQVANVLAMAFQVFGGQINGLKWLSKENTSFEGQRPRDLIDSWVGIESVLGVLRKIEWGNY